MSDQNTVETTPQWQQEPEDSADTNPYGPIIETSDPLASERNSRAFSSFLIVICAIILLSILLYLPFNPFFKTLLLLSLFAITLISYLVRKDMYTLPNSLPSSEVQADEVQKVDEGIVQTGKEEILPLSSQEHFEQLVQEALDAIPTQFRAQMKSLIVVVEDEPDKDTLKLVGTREGQTLLGLYHGVPITSWGYQHVLMPERITIYQQTIERHCGHDPERIRLQVRATVLHEVAHHFGMGHEEMPIWIK